MNKSNTKFFLITLGIIVLILGAVLSWGIYKIETNDSETQILIQKVDTRAHDDLLIQTLRNARSAAPTEVEAFEKAVLKEKDLVRLIESLEAKGRSLGLKVETLSVDKVEGKGGEPDQIKITIQTDGAWSASNIFLHVIESLPYRVIISDFSTAKAEVGWQSKVSFLLYVF